MSPISWKHCPFDCFGNLKPAPSAWQRTPSDFVVGAAIGLKEQRYAPQCGKAYERVYHPADRCGLSAADPCHNIEFEKAHAAPIDAADYTERKRNSVYDHHVEHLISRLVCPHVFRSFRKFFRFDKSSVRSLFTKCGGCGIIIAQLIQLVLQVQNPAHIFIPQPCLADGLPSALFI